jgi:purine-nucleoside phosphorylase
VEEFGPRFADMSHVYTPALQTVARQAAKELEIRLQEGVYMYFPGPQFETPAEIRAARVLGADAVGMSTVPEAIAAAHCGMNVLGFTLCTNMAAGVLDQPLSGEEVIEAGKAAAPRFAALVKACLRQA